MDENIKIGQFIKKARKDNFITLDQLAQELQISKSSLSRMENGTNSYDVSVLIKIISRLNLSLEGIVQLFPEAMNTKGIHERILCTIIHILNYHKQIPLEKIFEYDDLIEVTAKQVEYLITTLDEQIKKGNL